MNQTKTALICTALFIAVGASAAGYKLADKTGASIAEFRDEIVNIRKAADTSMAALDKVVATAAEDPRKAFKEFDKSVPRVSDAANKARKRAESMRDRGQDYFKDWERELEAVNNPDVRQLAEQRKLKLQTAFDGIKSSMEPVKAQFDSWVADLKDLQKYLGNDLTIEGIDAAKSLIAKTKTEGSAVQQSLDKVIAELNTVVATLTPSKVKKET